MVKIAAHIRYITREYARHHQVPRKSVATTLSFGMFLIARATPTKLVSRVWTTAKDMGYTNLTKLSPIIREHTRRHTLKPPHEDVVTGYG